MRRALAGERGLRKHPSPRRVAQSASLPAPTEGWDTESPVAELPQTRARLFDNWIAHGIQLELRKGNRDHVTGIGAAVETLMAYNNAASAKLFAAAGANVYNVTAAGAVGAAVRTGLGSARHSFVNFETAGGAFLWTCNGADAPAHYDGSSWANPSLTLTGFTADEIFQVFASKQRLFVLFLDSLTFGYLATDSIAGTVSNFPLGSVFSRGGRLIAGATMSRDGGDGLDDLTAFLTSEGEIAVFAGDNPGDAAAWSKVGAWQVGTPVGDRPFVALDGDLGVITEGGLVSLARVMAAGADFDPSNLPYVSARIATPFSDRARLSGAFDGWQGLRFPGANLLIVNTPTSASTAEQFVRHAVTGGWGRFTGWNFACFELFRGDLYAGGFDGRVALCWEGYSDDGEDIVGACETAWTALGSRGVVKRLVKARPIVTTQTGASFAMVARVDYADTPAVPTPSVEPLTDALIWGEGLWGVGRWGGRNQGARQWRTISGVGHAISFAFEARSNQSRFALNGIDLVFEAGGPV